MKILTNVFLFSRKSNSENINPKLPNPELWHIESKF